MNPAASDLFSPRILIVDDDRGVHAAIKLRLSKMYVVASCAEARSALVAIRETRFDLCLVDIRMPHMNGLTFITAAREIDPALGYVVISALDTEENLHRAIPLNIYQFISKPLPGKSAFEECLPDWIEQTRRRRRELSIAAQASTLLHDRETARLDLEVELVASESARDTLLQTAGLLSTIQAHLAAITTQLTARAKIDSSLAPLMRNLEEAKKTSDAATTVASKFFDSAYANRDSSPALVNEGIRHAIDLAGRIYHTDATCQKIDFTPIDGCLPIRGISGVSFLLIMVPAIGLALTLAPSASTVRLTAEPLTRLENATRDPRWRDHFWLNRKHAFSSSPGVFLTLSASTDPLPASVLDDWIHGKPSPLEKVASSGLISGIKKCQGLISLAQSPSATRFQLGLALPT